jgi:tetratricopeptide (TPR) repeat protein
VGYSTIGQFEKSLEHYQHSEEIMGRIGDVRGMSMVLLNLGVLYDRMGRLDTSLEYYWRSLRIKSKIGDSVGVANIYNNIGSNYLDLERYEDALEHFRKNNSLMERAGDMWGIARSLNNMGEAEIALGRFTDAKEHCAEALRLGEKHSLTDITCYANILMGVIASHDGDYALADGLLAKGLELGRRTEDPFRVGMAHLCAARSLAQRGMKQDSIDRYSQALKTFEESGMGVPARRVRTEMLKIVESEAGR